MQGGQHDIHGQRGTEQQARAIDYVRRCLGDVLTVLSDASVTDVNLNPDGRVWVTRLGGDAEPWGRMPASQAEALIAAVASTAGQVATRQNPVVEAPLVTDGSRFEGMLPPLVAAPSFSIRRPASAVFPLSSYVARGQLRPEQATRIEQAVCRRENILVVGGTGAGKTTLLNAVIETTTRLTPEHRIVAIEDTPELQCAAENAVKMLTSENVPAARALRVALRCFPDRIIVGEVRGPEALDMLMAWNTGHDGGACSLHSNVTTPRAALTRLESLVGLASSQPQCRLIGEAVGLIICVERVRAMRRVSQIVSVHGWDGNDYRLEVEH
jgi:type IV secretion system protein VirB11